MLKSGFLTLCCAFVPGAGQMYQDYMKRGLSLILITCFIGLAGCLLESLIIFTCVAWMYSFFDTLNLRAQLIADTAPEDDYLIHFDPRDKRLARAILDNHKVTGWALIAFGAFAAYNGVIMNIFGEIVYRWGERYPVFHALYMIMDILPSVVVCVTLIICGIWLVKGPRPAKKQAAADPAEDADFCEYHAERTAEPDTAVLLSAPVVNDDAPVPDSDK